MTRQRKLARQQKDMKHTNCRHKKLNFNFERGSCTLIATIAACLGSVSTARAQSAPLSLPFLVQQAGLHHPSVQGARLDAKAAQEDLHAVQRQRWPALSVIVENANGAAANPAATRLVRVEQSLWDAGRSAARIAESELNTDAGKARIQLQQQQLALQAVSAWQNLLASHAKALVAKATLFKLGGYQVQIQRRIQADASPGIDLELVQSRLLQTQVELSQAQTGIKTALNRLEQLSGVAGLAAHVEALPIMPGLDRASAMAEMLMQTELAPSIKDHPAVAKADLESQAAQWRIQAKHADLWPQLYARLDQPVAGGQSKTTAFVGLRFSPGAGFSTLAESQALDSRAASLVQAVEGTRREVLEALSNDQDEFFNQRQRAEALGSAVEASDKLLESYGRQFTAGRKSWQDLMNAVREVAQNHYALADAHAALLGAMHRLQIRLGQDVTMAMASAKP